MSQFLGNVHFIMYDKVLKREERMKSLLSSLSEDLEYKIMMKMDEVGTIQKGSLENIIDLSNIHGWLEERVILSEKRMAIFLQEVLKNISKEELLKEMEILGQQVEFTGNPMDLYSWMAQYLLDGMPCDRALALMENSEERLQFKVINDRHKPYLPTEFHDFYWDIRGSFLNGVLKDTPYHWIKVGNNTFEIR